MMELDKLLHNYLNGTATTSEIDQLKADPDYAIYLEIADTTTTLEAPDFNEAATFKSIKEKTKNAKAVKKLNPIASVLKIAAILAVLAAGYVFISSMDTSIKTEIAQKENITLPDASEVVLNANSQLVYNKKKWTDVRQLSLQGEAYFKVEKGSTFTVKTHQGDVTVLGTQFNVYSRDSIFNVHCYEGLVGVKYNGKTIQVAAGNSIKIENNKLIEQSQTADSFPVWIGNESSFENDAVITVLKALQAHYPIQISAPNHINAQRFTGSFTHTNLENALRAICAPLELEFTIDGDQVRIYAKGEK